MPARFTTKPVLRDLQGLEGAAETQRMIMGRAVTDLDGSVA